MEEGEVGGDKAHLFLAQISYPMRHCTQQLENGISDFSFAMGVH